MMITLDTKLTEPFVDEQIYNTHLKNAGLAYRTLQKKQSDRDAFLGWMDVEALESPIDEIEQVADFLGESCEVVVVVGIGGSYLGAKAVIEALQTPFDDTKPRIIFAGHHLDDVYHRYLLDYLSDKTFGIIVISKSGTTTEPAIAFRMLRLLLEKRKGKRFAKKHIIAITDGKKGALKQFADKQHYQQFVIPDNVGGRFSVLTPVGLLPIAVAGISSRALLRGAVRYHNVSPKEALRYAALRNSLYQGGYSVELLASFSSQLMYLAEWWKQLFGESEGKDGKGLFPASASFTTDLHSLGQFIQEGSRLLFETFISIKTSSEELVIPKTKNDNDGLNYLAGKMLFDVNKSAETGTKMAHFSGKVPIIDIVIKRNDVYHLGALLYFFELSCAVSGTILGVNPFNQPGVEAYKTNMFALLNKSGYENQRTALLKELSKLK